MDTRQKITFKVRGAELMLIERTPPQSRWTDKWYTQRDWDRDWRQHQEAPRMYVSVKDETILENLENRRRRPYNVYKKLIAASGIGDVFNLEGMRWSRHAGCTMCACSPGFVIPQQSLTFGAMEFKRFDVWVDLAGAPNVDARKPASVVLL